jgi:hypothetical protein
MLVVMVATAVLAAAVLVAVLVAKLVAKLLLLKRSSRMVKTEALFGLRQ